MNTAVRVLPSSSKFVSKLREDFECRIKLKREKDGNDKTDGIRYVQDGPVDITHRKLYINGEPISLLPTTEQIHLQTLKMFKPTEPVISGFYIDGYGIRLIYEGQRSQLCIYKNIDETTVEEVIAIQLEGDHFRQIRDILEDLCFEGDIDEKNRDLLLQNLKYHQTCSITYTPHEPRELDSRTLERFHSGTR